MKTCIRLLLLCSLPLFFTGCEPAEEFIFPNVEGPEGTSHIPPFKEGSYEKYGRGSTSRLAVLINGKTYNWVSLAHGLKTIGIPFVITEKASEAVQHSVIFTCQPITQQDWKVNDLRELRKFVFNGGTLIAAPAIDGLEDVFGYKETQFDYVHTHILLDKKEKINHRFQEEEERSMQIRDLGSAMGIDMFKQWSYTITSAKAVAHYENNTPAILHNFYGKGQTFTFGFDLPALLAQCYAYNANVWGSRYVNNFIPTVDVFLRMIKEIYIGGESGAVILGTVPFDKSLAVIFTHDVTSPQSMGHVLDYARYEASVQVPSTYFIVTKYMSDYNESYFFDKKAVGWLKEAASLGMEMGSHSVSHSRQFLTLPLGTGREQYPTYRPVLMNRRVTDGASILGELRVSKFLLENLVDNMAVATFRPGYLLAPHTLPEDLVGTGYAYSSSATANSTWSHLPFQLNYGYGSVGEVDIFEFPITLEDEVLPRMDQRLQEGVDVAKKIANYGGICVVLIHPDVASYRLDFERGFVEEVKSFSWFGTLRSYGDWWAARNAIEADVQLMSDKKVVTLSIPKTIRGLNFYVPRGWTYEYAQPDNGTVRQIAQKVVVEEPQKKMRLIFSTKG